MNTSYATGGCEALNDLKILIVGNGGKQWYGNAAEEDEKSWQLPRLAQTLIHSIIQSGETMAIQTGRSFLGDRLHNINFSLEEEVRLDDTKAIPDLQQFGYSSDLNKVQI